MIDHTAVLPNEMFGIRRQRSTAGAIMDLTSSLEESRGRHHTAHIAFLDVNHAFDALPHGATDQLDRSNIC